MSGPTADDHWALQREDLRREIAELAGDVDEARYEAKYPEVITRRRPPLPKDVLGEICFLRRWNSHTPVVTGEPGGGYFMRWNGRGTVIDPGCAFIRAFSDYTDYSLADVDMVIATHDHVDHCQDLGTLISLLRQFNRWQVENDEPPKTWDVIASHGVYDQYASMLRHPENQLFLNLHKPLAPGDVDYLWKVPGYLNSRAARSTLEVRQRSAINYYRGRRIPKVYGFTLACTRTHHHELLGERTGFGLTFDLRTSGWRKRRPYCRLSFSSDTAVKDGPAGVSVEELSQAWQDSDLLVLHVGTMEEQSFGGGSTFSRLPQHLGFFGVCDVLEKLTSPRLQMVVLAEWGSECGGNEQRSRFCELVADALTSRIGDRYYSVTRNARPSRGVPIVPCDVGLRVSLPTLGIWCPREDSFVTPGDVLAREDGEQIDYNRR